MSAVHVKVQLLGPPEQPTKPQTVEALVDTGATLSIFPGTLLRRVGVKPLHTVRTRLADGSIVRRSIGEVRLKLNGEAVTTRVLFGRERDAKVIGLVTLESLGLAVDPIRRRLVHSDFLLLLLTISLARYNRGILDIIKSPFHHLAPQAGLNLPDVRF